MNMPFDKSFAIFSLAIDKALLLIQMHFQLQSKRGMLIKGG